MPELHPAEHRGHRELQALARRLQRHWTSLAERLGTGEVADALRSGAVEAREVIAELEPVLEGYGLPTRAAAQGSGRFLAASQSVVTDRFLERNQAVRAAASEAPHLVTLADYLARLARSRGDDDLAARCRTVHERLAGVEQRAREAAVSLGDDPDSAVAPVDSSPAGQVAHRIAVGMGSLGEWADQRAAQRRG